VLFVLSNLHITPADRRDLFIAGGFAYLHAANAIARSIGTVTSDLLCAVTARVPRVYVA